MNASERGREREREKHGRTMTTKLEQPMGRVSSGVNAGRSTTAATSVATTHIPVRSPDRRGICAGRSHCNRQHRHSQHSSNGMYVPREDSSGAGRQVSSVENCSVDMKPRNAHHGTNTMKPQHQVRAKATAGLSLVLNPTLMQCALYGLIFFQHNAHSATPSRISFLTLNRRIYHVSCHRASQLSRDVPADKGYSINVPCRRTR
jgi:hypothetical protein